MFFSSFDKIRKLYKIKTENMIFAFDCPRSEIWRNKHFETYKSNRDSDRHKKGNIAEVFRYTYNTIFPSLEASFTVLILYFGIISIWIGATGLISLKANISSVSYIISAGISLFIILSNIVFKSITFKNYFIYHLKISLNL